MISTREITMNGLRGQEISFYTGEDVGINFFLGGVEPVNDPKIRMKIASDIGPSLGPGIASGLADTIDAINRLLVSIYMNFQIIRSEKQSDIDFLVKGMAQSKYGIEIHQLSYLLYKLCYALVVFKADKIVPRDGVIPPSILALFDPTWISPYKEQIIESLFNRPESIELFKISEDINRAFQSFHMFTPIGIIGEVFPTVCAYAPPANKDTAFLLHNHSVWQLIKAANTVLRDLNYL